MSFRGTGPSASRKHQGNGLRGKSMLDAQVKTGTQQYIQRSLRGDKYSGMAKVVPQGMEGARKGRVSQLCCGGACSTPHSREGALQLAEDPKAYFDALRPSLLHSI
ncbi:hypothetical protein COO60DRAFT_1644863 [Scenedesmus sp. NREL 46B-D3]|nr:hypothetical protein COO60DRAFT_1644863 [Scenedesmus sp. NREL 46B-D3]